MSKEQLVYLAGTVEILEAENAKLREQLAAAQTCNRGAIELIAQVEQRTEAAEAKLKATSEQKPCQYCNNTGDVHRADGEYLGECNECAPIQPTDVNEYAEKDSLIQQQDIALEQKEKRIAELERKLAEQKEDIAIFVENLTYIKGFGYVEVEKRRGIAQLVRQIDFSQKEENREICPNCESSMPDGCLGLFKKDGIHCWRNRE